MRDTVVDLVLTFGLLTVVSFVLGCVAASPPKSERDLNFWAIQLTVYFPLFIASVIAWIWVRP